MNVVISMLRTGAQALVGYLVTYLAAKGVNVPVEAQSWVVEVLLVGGGIALYTAAQRWLETRKGDALPARVARWLGRALVGGLPQPTYKPAE